MSRFERGLLTAIMFGAAFYLAFAVWADIHELRGELATFVWWHFPMALGLAFLNYQVRVIRWGWLLRALDVRLDRQKTALSFFAGFAMTLSPGKVGELLKAWLLKRSDEVPLGTSTPVIVTERLSDAFGLATLVPLGIWSISGSGANLQDVGALAGAVFAVTGGLVFALTTRPVMVRLIALASAPRLTRRFREPLSEGYGRMRNLLTLRIFGPAALLGCLSWTFEGLALWWIVEGFQGTTANPLTCILVYTSTALIGAFSFVPGGLGVTDATMGAGLEALGQVSSTAMAVGATLLTRLATLWFAVTLGVIALTVYRVRYLGGVSIAEATEALDDADVEVEGEGAEPGATS